MVTVPALRIVTVFPLILATVGSPDVKVTVRPEVAVAERVNGASPTILPGNALNVMVWEVFGNTVSVWVACVAAL